jgi:aldehyde dehydrogenase (NAD+)
MLLPRLVPPGLAPPRHREFANPLSFNAKTGPAQFPVTTFGRPAGALAGALAAVRDRILAEDDQKTD